MFNRRMMVFIIVFIGVIISFGGVAMEVKTMLNSFEKLEEVDRFVSKAIFTLVSQAGDYKTDGKYSCKIIFLSDGSEQHVPKVQALYREGAYPYRNWSAYEKFVMDIYNPQPSVVTLYLSLQTFTKTLTLEPNKWTKVEVPVADLKTKSISEIALSQKPAEMDRMNTLYIDNLRLEGGDLTAIEENKKEEDATASGRKPRAPSPRSEAAKLLPEFTPNLGVITQKFDVPAVAKTQVLVVGGGLAGCAAAICAARNGAEVLLIERAGWLGGMSTSGLVPMALNVPLNEGIVREWVNLLKKLGGDNQWENPVIIKYALYKLCQEAGVKLMLYTLAVDAVVENNVIKGVIVESKSGRQAILADIVIDATGDGDVAAKAGAPFEVGRGRNEGTQTMTLVFVLGNVNTTKITPDSWKKGYNITKIVNGEHGAISINYINIGGVQGLDVRDLTYANLECMRRILEETHKKMQKDIPGCEESYVADMAPYMGVRETRRIMGEYVLTGGDVLKGVRFDDAVARGFYPIDIHHWDGSGDVGGLGVASPYDIPYRCLVPLKIDNLLIAGRPISADHAAHGSLRVQGTTMSIGQAVGTAAALCVKEKVTPRKLKPELLISTLIKQGANLEREKVDPGNLALSSRGTRASADSVFQNYSPIAAIDGTIKGGMTSRWLSDKTDPPHWLVLDFGSPKTFQIIRLHFWTPPDSPSAMGYIVRSYSLQYEKNGEWVDIVSVEDNKEKDPEHNFKPVTAQKVRFYVTKPCDADNIVRLYEIEVLEK